MGKWPVADLDLGDPLNHDIWEHSPTLQAELDAPRVGREGDVGAAQAMVGAHALPWVPDIVGPDWRRPDAVLVVGSSYADFFSPFASRSRRFSGQEYNQASGVAAFQRRFVTSVVEDDAAYYDKILDLLRAAGVSPRRVVLTDLCRASFVQVRAGRADARERVLVDHAARFATYVGANARWHARRLDEFGGTVIVTLGHLAMRGLLHLLDDGRPDHSWVRPALTPQHVTRSRGERELRILRVPHPGARQGRPADGAAQLRALVGGASLPASPHDPPAQPRAGRVGDARPSAFRADELWREALRDAAPLEAASLLARDPRAQEHTAVLLDRITAKRVVAIANAMFNPCRPANLTKAGRPATPQEAWRVLLERRDLPYVRAGTKWERLIAALEPVPPIVVEQVRGMDIRRLGALSAALINGPYDRM